MAIIEPVRKDIERPGQIKKNSAPLRLWHWLNAIVITGSLLTVLLNSTLTNSHKNAAIIKSQLQEKGVAVTAQQARSAAHEISDNVWGLHTYFGYVLAGLVVFRLLLEIFQVADQKFIRKLKSAYANYQITKHNRELARHEFWVKTLYAVFYLMIIIQVLTGLCLVFEDDVPALKAIRAFRQIHSINMYLILGFISLHLAGVFLAERKDSPGIVSGMINGGKS
jgi:Ni/Fe-hydrogenase 1 B-type cytochrome subunit